ncbi:MAG: hypothetical protein AAFY88_06865, partial [Acidobacteriota bacterium]
MISSLRVLAVPSPARFPGKSAAATPDAGHCLRPLALVLGACLLAATPAVGQLPDGQVPGGPAHRPVAEPLDSETPPSTAEARSLWLDFYAEEGLLQREDDLVIADAYLAILDRWAAAPTLDHLALLSEFEARLDRSDRCFESIEERNLEVMNARSPGTLAPALILHVYSWRHHLDHGRFNFLAGIVRRVVRWAEWHAESSPNQERARQQAAGILTRFGGIIWDSGYVDLLPQATAALDAALEHAPEHRVGRYLRALIAEKEGRYRDARRDFRELHRLAPARASWTARWRATSSRSGA